MIFGPKTLAEHYSPYSGTIRVVATWGGKYLATGSLTQSGGLVKDVWEPVLRQIARPGKSWLILGLAGGTIAGIIARRFRPTRLVGVEIDPVMIDLGRKYLDLDKILGLEIVTQDAHRYVSRSSLDFDFVLVDMYLGDRLPDFIYDAKFLKRLRKIGRTVVFNHLFYDLPKKQLAEGLVAQLKTLFPRIRLVRKLTNLLIICDHGQG